MPMTTGTYRGSLHAFVGVGLLAMTGCVMGPTGDPGLGIAIKEHYASHATEEDGACRSPKIDTIQAHRVIDRSEEGDEVMMVRYSYFDKHADMDANWDKLVFLSQPCGGIAERRFVLARDQLGYRVTEMGGERRGGIRDSGPDSGMESREEESAR